jgi:acyl-CoA thioesterase FadM
MLEEYEIGFRVLPFLDTDVTRLFTQTYAVYTALARWHYIFSSEIGPIAIKNKWIPVTIAETFTFRRSIRNLEKVRVRTEMVCWNQHGFFLRQTFLVKGEVRAIAYTEGVVRAPSGHLKPAEAFRLAGMDRPSPEMLEDVRLWNAMQTLVREHPADSLHSM